MEPQLRPADVAADNDEIARIHSKAYPEWPCTGAEIAANAQRRAARFRLKWVAALAADRLAGYGHIEVPDVAAAAGRLHIRVTVDPDCRGLGLGTSLYNTLETEARRRGATELVSEVLASDPRAERFALDRGFVIYNSRIESRLPLRDVATECIGRGIDELTDRLFSTGIRVASYRQIAQAVEQAPRRLYDLYCELWRDVPFGITGPDPSFQAFVSEEVANPAFRPDGSYIALDGADLIALCIQTARGRHLLTSMTGVVRRWRGRGVARWLKLHSILHALEVGADQIHAFNDASNAAILALNRSLGFVRVNTELRLKKELQ
jgi:mycothiol synthase